LIVDDFIFTSKEKSLNKKWYIHQFDSLKKLEAERDLITIQNLDSVVKTEEKLTNIFDSLLEVTPKIIQKITYRFKDEKIKSITVDSTLFYDEHSKSLNDKIVPFAFYIYDRHNIYEGDNIMDSIRQYITEYNSISVADKKKYRAYSFLQGTYISFDNPYYHKLVFKGKTTVVVIDAIFGMSFASSYVLDEDYIRIRTDKSDLLLQIKDNKTLIGEGFASGTFIKSNE
jgi:hypothetical protein